MLKLTALLALIPFVCLLGCYPMPKEGEYSTVPTINNPDVVGSHDYGLLPNHGTGF